MNDGNNDTGGYHRQVSIDSLSANERSIPVDFPSTALAAVAERLEVEGVLALSGSFSLTRKDRIIHVSGAVEARLVRQCVLSLEEMEEAVSDSFSFELEQVDTLPDLAGEIDIDADMPEPFVGDTIDLADLAIQQVSLAMDPFPRKQGAEPVRDEGEQPSLSPFSVLKSMKED